MVMRLHYLTVETSLLLPIYLQLNKNYYAFFFKNLISQ